MFCKYLIRNKGDLYYIHVRCTYKGYALDLLGTCGEYVRALLGHVRDFLLLGIFEVTF
jgi:hypothetical protein